MQLHTYKDSVIKREALTICIDNSTPIEESLMYNLMRGLKLIENISDKWGI